EQINRANMMNCPPGLEYLLQVKENNPFLAGYETSNKYKVLNSLGQIVYLAAEESNLYSRQFFGPLRSFRIHILDHLGHEVIQLVRPFRCSGCCGCCMQQMEVQAPPGTVVGYIFQTWHPCLPRFTIQNELKEPVLRIHGPCFVGCSVVIKSFDETETIGKISKQFSGLLKEIHTDTDLFGIQFPIDLDVKMKAVMLGACLLIDYMFYEESNN
uniref:Phospholipid scramblase n=1 Tax=Callorhinchus milii TaxID=7868 RepID=A0A4W3H5B2_CALMI